MAKPCLLFCLVAVGFSVVIASQEGVPALLWTNDKSDFPTPLVGHTTRPDEFKTDYLQNNIGKAGHALVAFIQDKLSLEDFIDNADVYNEHSTGSMFANLKRIAETHLSVHLPAVFSPGQTLKKLARSFKGKVHQLTAPYSINDLKVDPTVPNLVLVNLPHNDGRGFDKIDAIIGSLTDGLESLKVPFTAVYTGKKPSQPPMIEESTYTGRRLLAQKDGKPSNSSAKVFAFPSCMLAYQAVHFNICTVKQADSKAERKCDPKSGSNRGYILTSTADTKGTECENSTGKMILTFPKQNDLEKFVMEFEFNYTKSNFWATDIKVSYTIKGGSSKNESIEFTTRDVVSAPKQFSYHCYTPYPFKEKNSTAQSQSQVLLGIHGFQVQFGKRFKDRFDRPNDCESFFSTPVLSGLFVGLLLISILMFGICMILNISTMDRFDDPKGKTINVNTAEG